MKRIAVTLGLAGMLSSTVSFAADARRPERLDADVARFVRAELAKSSDLNNKLDRELEAQEPTRIAVARVRSRSGGPLVIVRVTGGIWCGGTGMCTTMVLKPHGKSFDILFEDSTRAPVRILPTSTRGYPDLSVVLHEDWQTIYDIRLRFDGKRYVYGDKIGGYDHGRKIRRRAGKLLIDGTAGVPLNR